MPTVQTETQEVVLRSDLLQITATPSGTPLQIGENADGDLSFYSRGVTRCYFHADASANAFIAAHPSTAQFLMNNNRNIQLLDAESYTQVRISHRVVTKSTSTNSPRLVLKYKTTYSQVVAEYVDMGEGDTPAEVTATIGSYLIQTSGWVTMNTAARAAGIYIAIFQVGGDSSSEPRVASVVAEFR